MFDIFVLKQIKDAIARHENKASLAELRKEAIADGIDCANRLIIDAFDDNLALSNFYKCQFYKSYNLQDKLNEVMVEHHKQAEKNARDIYAQISGELQIPSDELGLKIYTHQADRRFTTPPLAMRFRISMPEKYIKELKEAIRSQEEQIKNRAVEEQAQRNRSIRL